MQAQVSGTNTQLLICQHIGQVQGNVGSHQGKMRCSVKKLQNNPEISTFPKSVRRFSRCEANTQQMFKTWAGAAEESTELSSKTLFFLYHNWSVSSHPVTARFVWFAEEVLLSLLLYLMIYFFIYLIKYVFTLIPE